MIREFFRTIMLGHLLNQVEDCLDGDKIRAGLAKVESEAKRLKIKDWQTMKLGELQREIRARQQLEAEE